MRDCYNESAVNVNNAFLWLARRLAIGEVPDSNPGKGEND